MAYGNRNEQCIWWFNEAVEKHSYRCWKDEHQEDIDCDIDDADE